MKIVEHRLDPVKWDPIEGGEPMLTRRCLVVHFTEGASAKSSIDFMRERGLSVHLVIDRDGTIYQCRRFGVRCSHAGRSRWVDPKTGVEYGSANTYAIGIELANAGSDPGVIAWAKRTVGASTIMARHRNDGHEREWETFPEPQLKSLFEVSKLLKSTYNLDDITGHDCIAPERKDDPGPAFPMEKLRRFCGFTGLPTVHHA